MRRNVIIFCSLFLVTCILTQPIFAQQDSLADAQVVLNNVLWNYSAQHQISFTLPSDSYPIRNIDYIQIYYPGFTNLTAPWLVSGQYAGIPVFSVSGQYARVTGITVSPGARITIDGITATNPDSDEGFQVVLMVTEDEAGTQLKNYRSVIATLNHADVSISGTIPNPLGNLRLMGGSSPDMFIIFSESSAVIGTDVATPLGAFNRLFTGLQPTTHRITLYGIDSFNRTTSSIPLTIYTPAFLETTINNLLLSPTLELNQLSYLSGDPIIASGSAIPSGEITLFVDVPLRTYTASTSADGFWSYTITNSNEYVLGDYRIYALVQNSQSLQSLVSNSINFSLVASSSAVGSPCGDISQGDLNCDTNIDLTDFSILMYYWGSANQSADINLDNLVNLTDFSILMYWWGT